MFTLEDVMMVDEQTMGSDKSLKEDQCGKGRKDRGKAELKLLITFL